MGERSGAFQELNEKYDLTKTLSEQTRRSPSELGSAASELEDISVGLLKNLISAVTIAVIAFFLLLEGPGLLDRFLRWLGGERERRGRRMVDGVYGVVKGYVTINLTLAIAAGLFTWVMLELLGVELAVPMAILMAVFDLIPLIGLTIGGLVVAVVAALHSFPDALRDLAGRVHPLPAAPGPGGPADALRPRGKVNPLVAVLVLLAGAQILGILGACWRSPSPRRSPSSSRPCGAIPDRRPRAAARLRPEGSPRLRGEDDLADVLPLVDEAVRVGGAIERERLGDDRLEPPSARSGASGSITRSRSPSWSHHESMLSPKTPLFSFMIAMLFHHGIVAVVMLARPLSRPGMLRPSPDWASARPKQISRPPGRSSR